MGKKVKSKCCKRFEDGKELCKDCPKRLELSKKERKRLLAKYK